MLFHRACVLSIIMCLVSLEMNLMGSGGCSATCLIGPPWPKGERFMAWPHLRPAQPWIVSECRRLPSACIACSPIISLMPCTLLPAGLDIFGTLPASEDNLAAVEEVCLQVRPGALH